MVLNAAWDDGMGGLPQGAERLVSSSGCVQYFLADVWQRSSEGSARVEVRDVGGREHLEAGRGLQAAMG